MNKHDPGAGNPEEWSALCLSAATGQPLEDCEILYNLLDDDEWAEYCAGIPRKLESPRCR